jgi:hypothetical protein
MTVRKLIIPALAAVASATVSFGLIPIASATPIGPCADVPFIGVCVPASQQPTPPQQSSGETAFIPDSTSGIGIHVVN